MNLYEVAAILNPSPNTDQKETITISPTCVLAPNESSAAVKVIGSQNFSSDELDRLEVLVRPFG